MKQRGQAPKIVNGEVKMKIINRISQSLLLVGFMLSSKALFAATFPLPPRGDDIVGQLQTYVVQRGDNFPKIAQKYEVTYTGLIEANPGVNPQAPSRGTALIIPSKYVLPNVPRQGIVVNLAELRLYYFPAHKDEVITYPVGIGVTGTNLPAKELKIVEKVKNPSWYIPPDIHKELAKEGYNLPDVLPPGPDNPLGDYKMRLSDRTFLIHGVVDPSTVGRLSSHGCMRMYPEDIKALFGMVPVGTPVRIINQPYKVGWNDGKLYLEAHLPLHAQQVADTTDQAPIMAAVHDVANSKKADVNWNRAFALGRQHMGLPEVISGEG